MERMTGLLRQAYDPELFREEGHKLVDILAEYLKRCYDSKNSSLKVLPWQSPEKMLEMIREKSTSAAKNISVLMQQVLSHSIHLHHPRCMGHQVTPPLPLSALVELATGLLNNSMAVYEVGPYSTAIERYVTDWVCSLFGFEQTASNGILTSGGSIGNLTALLAARQACTGSDIWREGNPAPLGVLVSSASHYSIERAVKIMGLGENGLIKVPVNKRFEISTVELKVAYERAREQGREIIAVVANACSTATGSYDPLKEIAEFCKIHRLWLHVDAAHGGGVVLTDKYKHLVQGIGEADSIVLDFHKMLMLPALTTAVVFKKGEHSHAAFSQKASYLLADDEAQNWFDVARRTLECTKKMMGLKIFLVLNYFGEKLFSEYITKTYDLARTFARLIKCDPDFELALDPQSNIVCFRYCPSRVGVSRLDPLNQKVRNKIKEEGDFYIVQTEIDQRIFLRVTLMNPFTGEKDLKDLLEKIRQSAG